MLKQLKNAIVGPNGLMEMKELVTFVLLLLTIFMVVIEPIKGYQYAEHWVYAICFSLVTSVGISVHQKVKMDAK